MKFCIAKELTVTNTQYRKQNHKLYTYIHNPSQINNAQIQHNTHFQLDYILIPRRWRNGITNVEADATANIPTPHSPVVATASFCLKAGYHTKKTIV